MITVGTPQEPNQPSRRRCIARRLRAAAIRLRVPARRAVRVIGLSLAKRIAWEVVCWAARTLFDIDVQLFVQLHQLLMQ
ncbi:hypothetical protein ACGRHY_28605 [Streptomyces sp. HK10]|uniref:hypothetical protein n=1 Tax=Streptomyces sp. HK10 TaxID=3373255 RepID=UPI003748E8C3